MYDKEPTLTPNPSMIYAEFSIDKNRNEIGLYDTQQFQNVAVIFNSSSTFSVNLLRTTRGTC